MGKEGKGPRGERKEKGGEEKGKGNGEGGEKRGGEKGKVRGRKGSEKKGERERRGGGTPQTFTWIDAYSCGSFTKFTT